MRHSLIGKEQLQMAQMSGKSFPKRGEVYWADLDPAIGSETQKRRPGLIVSNDIGNELSRVVMVAPISSKATNIYPFEVKTEINGKPAKIMLNQCRALDKIRLQKYICELDFKAMHAVDEAIKLVFCLE